MKYQVTIGSLTTEIEASDEMEAIRLCRLQCPKDTSAAVVAELPESHESESVVDEPIVSELDPVEPAPFEPVEPVVSNDDNNE